MASASTLSILPLFTSGIVIKGFGRGSKALGTPTANFDSTVIQLLPPQLHTGIYFGWAQLNRVTPVYQMVTSVGFNPYFGNQVKSMETHIIQTFENDFYGSELRICLAGFLRDERNFDNIDALKEAIQNDIEDAKQQLLKPEFQRLSEDAFFSPDSPEQNLSENSASDQGRKND